MRAGAISPASTYHYETQPMPNPLSWFLHWSPIVDAQSRCPVQPFRGTDCAVRLLLPQPFAGIAGIITIMFQLSIIVSGNLSWLNWLTLILAFSCLDGRFLHLHIAAPLMKPLSPVFQFVQYWALAIVVTYEHSRGRST